MTDRSGTKIGLLYSISLVVGNMIGSGIFLLPASLAVFGSLSIVGWILSFIGAVLLSTLFGNLSLLIPNAAGGPYEFTKHEFGHFPAFIVAWSYWTSIWFANAAIVVALLGYLSVFFPILKENTILTVMTGWMFIWLFTWINTKTISFVSLIQLITTILKIVPLLLIGIVGLFYIDYQTISFDASFDISQLTTVTTLTFFAFLGLESASITGDQVKGGIATIKTATMIGTLVTAIIYISSSFVVMSLVNHQQLSVSTSPFSDASSLFLGPASTYFVALGAIFSTLGALNGWILIQGHIPMVAAKDKLFPDIFGVQNENGSPSKGIMITSIVTSALLLMNYIEGLVPLFTLLISLSTLSVMIPYFFSVASYISINYKNQKAFKLRKITLPLICIGFLIWIVSGCGWSTIFYGFSFLAVGILLYIFKIFKIKRINF